MALLRPSASSSPEGARSRAMMASPVRRPLTATGVEMPGSVRSAKRTTRPVSVTPTNLSASGGWLCLAAPRPWVRRLLEHMCLRGTFTVYPTVAQARNELAVGA